MAVTEAPPVLSRGRTYEELEEILSGIDAPFAFVDLDAMWSNAGEMLARAVGKPIRVASKSVRCRPLLEAILAHDPGFRGLMTFTLPESLWLPQTIRLHDRRSGAGGEVYRDADSESGDDPLSYWAPSADGTWQLTGRDGS